ncbi:hypothetical protein HPB49_004681 [Dermacentor silvarum]|uniref:Uncharacterized protein n=1 Tax=Dermacentor silvarum TaxID=543639 RepID=A0ACB8C252_DERSI|nr:hypothetical protein HPB49_004681 [Dermacentor silvarum]
MASIGTSEYRFKGGRGFENGVKSVFGEACRRRTKKRKFLSLEEKAKVIAQAEGGKRKSVIAEEFGIPASSLSTILKCKDAIVKALASGTSAKHKKVTQPVHEDLDKAVYTWFVETRAKKIALSGDITSDSENEDIDGDGSPSDEVEAAWAALLESGDVPAGVHPDEYIQADSCVVVREEMTDEDILNSVREDCVSSDEDDAAAQREPGQPTTSQVFHRDHGQRSGNGFAGGMREPRCAIAWQEAEAS